MSTVEGPLRALIDEAERALSICNACRYCEGYCAVFPALERRLAFREPDIHYLANLCHNCGSCLYACQYAPPHPFQLNFPRILAQVRMASYQKYAWPACLAAAYERNGLVVAAITLVSVALLFVLAAWLAGSERLFAAHSDAQGAFYAVIPHNVLVGVFGTLFAFVLVAFAVALVRFWRDSGERATERLQPGAVGSATFDALSLKYLDAGGEGCTYPTSAPSFSRRNFHHLTFYGFLLCLAATIAATVYHYAFGWPAPYPWTSLPVILGTLGGLGLLIGPLGLIALRARRDPDLADPHEGGMDLGLLALLFATSLTGLALLALRETAAMGVLLAFHLGAVMALFVTMPYGKFVHVIYRTAALVRFHVERQRPLPQITAD